MYRACSWILLACVFMLAGERTTASTVDPSYIQTIADMFGQKWIKDSGVTPVQIIPNFDPHRPDHDPFPYTHLLVNPLQYPICMGLHELSEWSSFSESGFRPIPGLPDFFAVEDTLKIFYPALIIEWDYQGWRELKSDEKLPVHLETAQVGYHPSPPENGRAYQIKVLYAPRCDMDRRSGRSIETLESLLSHARGEQDNDLLKKKFKRSGGVLFWHVTELKILLEEGDE